MEPQIEKFHNWLFENSPFYSGMVVIGSDATGDVKIEGRSDHDIMLIFAQDFRSELPPIKRALAGFAFNDDYLFIPFTKDDFVRSHNSSHDFSRRFRAKTLFGEDLVPLVQLPEMSVVHDIYSNGLADFYERFAVRIMNSSVWSEKKVRTIYWHFMKDAFMYLAIKQYYDTRNYPRTRDEIVRALASPVATAALELFKEINTADKEKIVVVAQTFLDYAGTLAY